jgi:hypothetical protein
VYGPSDDSNKPLFLDELALLKPPVANPWIVLGYCNLIYEARDKNNLNVNCRFMGRFHHVLDTYELCEFELQKNNFTWTNEIEDAAALVRPDRVFCNKECDLMLVGFRLQALYL